MKGTHILLGSNMGKRLELLEQAYGEIQKLGINIVCKSPIYESEAWGVLNQNLFLNQVLEITTNYLPLQLLDQLLLIETVLGRKRKAKWGARLIDIDILFYNDESFVSPKLTLPHPEIANRRFTLLPLCDLCPNEIHPINKKSIKTIANECNDPLRVWQYT